MTPRQPSSPNEPDRAPAPNGRDASDRRAREPRGPRASWMLVTIVGAGLLVGLLVVLLALPRWLTSPPPQSSTPSAPPAATAERTVPATLYAVSDDGESLVGVSRQVPMGASPAEQARRIVEAQLAAPTDGSIWPVPAGVTLRGLYLTARGDAYVDLSRDIIARHPGGSLNEALTVYAIVNVLTSNVREVTAVQILVEGAQVDSLAGHIDLRQPLAAGPRWIQKGQ